MGDLQEPAPGAEKPKRIWRQNLLLIGGTLGYMILLFCLWGETGRPESFGIRITAHGKAGLLENWYYSYLLLDRPDFWDILTFLYMWAPVAAGLMWLGRSLLRRGTGGSQGNLP